MSNEKKLVDQKMPEFMRQIMQQEESSGDKWDVATGENFGAQISSLQKQLAAEKACAAIKDAEIAERLTTIEAQGMAIHQHLKEIASRDLMIKELREAMLPFAALLQEHNESGDDSKSIFGINSALITLGDIRKAKDLSNSEHHNSKVLEKMLLEAEIKGLRNQQPVSCNARLIDCCNKLAELNKE